MNTNLWKAVPGHADIQAEGQTVGYTNAAPSPLTVYRARVWLE